MPSKMLPLDGVRVIDMSRVLAGPVCGALLADMGADVIKIEDVRTGDESRHWAPQVSGQSPVFIANNRNKRSVAIDLKAADGQRCALALLDSADIVIENFGTGAMERLGLGFDTLRARNPRLIFASIAAFGRRGPRAQEAGYEALMQAFSGVMSITGEAGRAPVRCGISALDIFTGTITAFAVVNAVLLRQRTGVGQRIDSSLFDSALGLLNFQAQTQLLCGIEPKPMGSAHPSLVPYQSFRCQDERWVFIAAGNDRLWRRLVLALGQPDWAEDPRFADNVGRVTHRDELIERIEHLLQTLPAAEVVARCRQSGVPATSVNSVSEALADAQAAHAATIRPSRHPVLGPIDVVGMPVAFSDMPQLPAHPAPALGEHTLPVLRSLGFSEADLDDLCRRGVLYSASSSFDHSTTGDLS